MARYGRTTRIQRILLFVGIVLFVLGITITIGIPPMEAVPDLPEWSSLLDRVDPPDWERLPVERGDLPLVD